jgi:uncharacterized protein
MKIVVDTNVLLPSLSPRSNMHWLFSEILAERLTLCVTTDILSEYAEVFERKLGASASLAVMDLIMTLPNLLLVNKFYFWQAIEIDPDDNKFIDCAVAATARYLISDDSHFNILKKKPLFEVEILTFKEFDSIYHGT